MISAVTTTFVVVIALFSYSIANDAVTHPSHVRNIAFNTTRGTADSSAEHHHHRHHFDNKYVFLDNGLVKVGVSLTRGGSIGYLARSGYVPSCNVINSYDMGREVQMSFYSGPSFYNPDNKCNKLFQKVEWPWNPIGAGDIMGNHGTILYQNFTANSASGLIISRPLQWACNNVPCECEFEKRITLMGNGVRVEATLRNHRSDPTVYPEEDQELPAVYSNGQFYRLMTTSQDGKGKIVELITGFNDSSKITPWIPGHFQADENWAALVDSTGWGLGVINYDTSSFLGGFFGNKGAGGTHDPQTGYIAPVAKVVLPPHTTYTYTFFLVVGNVDAIRAYAKQARPPDQQIGLNGSASVPFMSSA